MANVKIHVLSQFIRLSLLYIPDDIFSEMRVFPGPVSTVISTLQLFFFFEQRATISIK